MNTDKLKGIAVISQTEGVRLGRVVSTLFDPATMHLRAFRVKGDGQNFVVPFDQVKNIGSDAVIVQSSQATQVPAKGGEFDALIDFDALKKLKVVDATGTFVGTINDIELEPTTGHTLTLLVHKGGLLGFGGESTRVKAEAINSVGSELITIDALEPHGRRSAGAQDRILTPYTTIRFVVNLFGAGSLDRARAQ